MSCARSQRHDGKMNLLLYALCIFSLAQASVFNRIAASPPELIGFWRLLMAGTLIGAYALLTKKVWVRHSSAFKYALISGAIFFVHLWTYSYAAQNTSISNCMIIFSTNPLFTAIGAHFFMNERLAPKVGVAYVLEVLGLYILVSDSLSLGAQGMSGNLSALVAALMYSGYILSGKKARLQFSNTQYTTIIYFFGSLFFLATCLVNEREIWPLENHTLFGITGLILVSTLLGHALFTYLLQHLNVNWMSCGKLSEPIVATITAYLVFNQKITEKTLGAFALTSMALLILYLPVERWLKKVS